MAHSKEILNQKETNWLKIFVFYFIACAISWPFFILRDFYPNSQISLSIPMIVKNLAGMWGPGISAIACFIIYRSDLNFILDKE